CWDVRFKSGKVRRYRGLVLASGVAWNPNFPKLRGEFTGQFLHSIDYKVPEDFARKRVLVIGGGNSGCDIAADLGPVAAKTLLSVRRGYYFVPRFVFGIPSDQFGEFSIKMGTPMVVRQYFNQWMVHMILGHPTKLGLPKPDHRMFESHPIVNAEVLDEIRAGRVTAKPDVAELSGDRVRFKDDSDEAIDSIICATGYRISFPFIEQSHLNGPEGKPGFYLHLFHPYYDNLFIVGMIQPASGVWGLMDDQARLIAAYIRANARGSEAAKRFDELKSKARPDLSAGVHYIDSDRHFTEVDHTTYRKYLRKSLRLLTQ
ncbi:MAG: flavin-containing monooxygenase, partial [Methylococcales bacterium]